jgi:hypothetical protein
MTLLLLQDVFYQVDEQVVIVGVEVSRDDDDDDENYNNKDGDDDDDDFALIRCL